MKPQLPYFWLRTPMLSIERLVEALTKNQWSELLNEPTIGDAIRIASPMFFLQMSNEGSLQHGKIRQTALKYVLRMGSRATPFGLFASYSQGKVENKTNLDLGTSQLVIHRRLDMTVLEAITHKLSEREDLLHSVCYFPNSSLYRAGTLWRFTEIQADPVHPGYFLNQIEPSPLIDWVLAFAGKGVTQPQLVGAMMKKKHDPEQAQWLVSQFIQDQVLVSELQLSATGPDSLRSLISTLQRQIQADNQLEVLRRIEKVLTQPTFSEADERLISDLLASSFDIQSITKPLFQVDSQRVGASLQLNPYVRNTLQHQIEKLGKLSQLFPSQRTLAEFKQRFYHRYEEREMPLGLVLDSEIGIGYGGLGPQGDVSLLEDLFALPPVAPESSPLDAWLVHQYDQWLDQKGDTLWLTENDLATLPEPVFPFPDSYFALGYFLADSARTLDNGAYQFVLKTVGGASAFDLMSRFGQNNTELTELIRSEFTRQQSLRSNQVLAEVAHLPSAEAGNVIQRPHLRSYEIPYLSGSSLPATQQIRLDDLWISVPGGKQIVLRSKRLGKEISPRLTTAHNFPEGLPIYRFLGDLQYQDCLAGIKWHWGKLSNLRYLPRVQFHHIILQEASWRLALSDLDAQVTDSANVITWQLRWRWPRFMAIVQGDQELFLDLQVLDCQHLLTSTLKRLKTLRLIEWLRTPDRCCVEGPTGKLTHEVILPFINPQVRTSPCSPTVQAHSLQQLFLPGSEWLYLKVYCGGQSADSVLKQIGLLAQKSIAQKLITHWFFIRFQDPDAHLRIRFHLVKAEDNQKLLSDCQKLLQSMLLTGLIFGVQVNAYQREIERYGPTLMEATEWLFWADSVAVFSLLKGQPTEKERLAAAFWSVNQLVEDFGYSQATKADLFLELYTSFSAQSKDQKDSQKKMAGKYRKNESWVKEVLLGNCNATPETGTFRIISARSRQIRRFIATMSLKEEQKVNLLASLLHLSINRLFNHHQLLYERLIYHHLARAFMPRRH